MARRARRPVGPEYKPTGGGDIPNVTTPPAGLINMAQRFGLSNRLVRVSAVEPLSAHGQSSTRYGV
jgi:hypothetical protein